MNDPRLVQVRKAYKNLAHKYDDFDQAGGVERISDAVKQLRATLDVSLFYYQFFRCDE